jgi:hypothetical protein
MTEFSTFVPGTAIPGQARPGFLAAAHLSGGVITVTTTPQLIAAASGGSPAWQLAGALTITAIAGTAYLGAAGVSGATGAGVTAVPLRVPLFGGDQLYAVTAAGTATITVLQTGA